jgi:hypothetical protein
MRRDKQLGSASDRCEAASDGGLFHFSKVAYWRVISLLRSHRIALGAKRTWPKFMSTRPSRSLKFALPAGGDL